MATQIRTGDRRREYLDAVRGEAPGATPHDMETVSHVPDYEEVVARIAEAIIRTSMSRFPHLDVEAVDNPMDIADEAASDQRTQTRLLVVGLHQAKTSVRYWGVTHPDEEDWCAKCHMVFQVTEMEGRRCQDCARKRNKGAKRLP